ncbi:hypothetical protein OG21DRAFT_1094507 [Imleria badia]|nr:hypothetical protein OG21DRAFT_1094507 [Imleria badia]
MWLMHRVGGGVTQQVEFRSLIKTVIRTARVEQNDCVTLAILTVVGYDYMLTFSNEIEYIWSKSWTWVSALFIIVRYGGLCGIVTMSLFGSSFLPGPEKMYIRIRPPR